MTNGPHRWRKSSRSGSQTNCVELADTLDLVRDSKNPTGPSLRVEITALLVEVKSGRFTR
ncbi:MAG TPA: DUF397 domain-containing protein [Pseudonocardiaceae bacterium]|nr:DUF397 domain-containing protein [Pseudonocardiaceae bacterium]